MTPPINGTVTSACQFCNSLCGIDVERVDNQITGLTGNVKDPVQDGKLCVKAPMMLELLRSADRIPSPLKRVAGHKGSPDSEFTAISWDEALGTIAQRLLALRDAGQAHTVVNRTTGRMLRGTDALAGRFFRILGSPNNTDVGPVCNDAGGNALAATLGLGVFTNGYGTDEVTGCEDLGAARFVLMLGTNQAETHPVTFGYLQRGRERTGARLAVVDPRRTATAAAADRWLAPKPHTDLALILGMLYHIVAKELFDAEFVRRWTTGFPELRRHLHDRGYTPEWAARHCDLDVEEITTLAEAYATAKPAAIYCNAGISHQTNAFQTYRAIAFLAAITGNIGVDGGGCNFMHNTWPGHLDLPPIQRDPGPPRHPALPVGPDSFAEAILGQRPYPIRALITSGNPLMSSANSQRVRDAYRELEFYVYTGLFMEESACYADLILPVCSGLEFDGVYMRRDDRAVRWQQQGAQRVGQARTDAEIWLGLAAKMAELDHPESAAAWSENFPRAWLDYRILWNTFTEHTPGMAGMRWERLAERDEPLRWPCPDGEHPGFSALYLDHPSWYDTVGLLAPEHAGKRFLTPSGRIELYTAELDRQLSAVGQHALPHYYTHPAVTGSHPRLRYRNELVPNPVNPAALTASVEITPELGASEEFPLMGIIGRAGVVHFASVTQWTPTGKQLCGIRLIQLNRDTAAELGIRDGDEVIVSSPNGAVDGTASLTTQIRPDTVYVPNSFADQQTVGDRFGLPRYQSANVLLDDAHYDNLSGQQAYKCFPCEVRRKVRKA